jgi:pyrimidine-specific ribonucleoside hydrolase
MLLIYDNDGSCDDVIALTYLLSCPWIKLAGITIAGTGSAHGARGASNFADLCFLLGMGNIPIAYGDDIQFDHDETHVVGAAFPEFLRQAVDNLLVGMSVPKNPAPQISKSAIQLMKTICETAEEKVIILSTGPLTNVAEFIHWFPNLTHKIGRVIMMGGAIDVPGNIGALDPNSRNTVAEWNILADPKSVQFVMASGLPFTLVPLDATNQVPMTQQFYASLASMQTPAVALIYKLLKNIVDSVGLEVFVGEYFLWDPLAAMICATEAIADFEIVCLKISIESAQISHAEQGIDGAAMVNVATKIKEPNRILDQLLESIRKKSFPLIAKNPTSLVSFFARANSNQAVKVNQVRKTSSASK